MEAIDADVDLVMKTADKTVKDILEGLTERQKHMMLSSLLIYTVQAMINQRGRGHTVITLTDAIGLCKKERMIKAKPQ